MGATDERKFIQSREKIELLNKLRFYYTFKASFKVRVMASRKCKSLSFFSGLFVVMSYALADFTIFGWEACMKFESIFLAIVRGKAAIKFGKSSHSVWLQAFAWRREVLIIPKDVTYLFSCTIMNEPWSSSLINCCFRAIVSGLCTRLDFLAMSYLNINQKCVQSRYNTNTVVFQSEFRNLLG